MSGPERLDHFMARANAAYYAGPDPLAGFTTAGNARYLPGAKTAAEITELLGLSSMKVCVFAHTLFPAARAVCRQAQMM